jgi:hypothetical protein
LRVFNYNSLPNYSLPINVSNSDIKMIMSNQYPTLNTSATRYNSDGVITYGDGSAKANAFFLNGLVIYKRGPMPKKGENKDVIR